MKRKQTAALLVSFVSLSASAAISLDLNTFLKTGAREATLSGASTSGASLAYLDNTASGRDDTGMVAVINSGSLTPFTQVGDTMTYSFSLSGITATNNQFTPVYRVGFDFGSTASLRYETSTGTQPNLRFSSDTGGNPFAGGTATANEGDWAPFELQFLRFDDGNEIDAVVSLELVAIDGVSGLYDYQMTVFYDSTINAFDENTKSYTFTGVDGDEVQSLFHVTNSAGMVDGDAYTISNASLEFAAVPEPSTYAVLTGFLGLGLVMARRRFKNLS